MKPIKLTLAGFGCFKQEVSVSFEDLSLFAIAGPTGSGKSTLLDGMTYALYDRTARLGSSVKDTLMTPGVDGLEAILCFDILDKSYRVGRTLRRKPSGKLEKQARLETLKLKNGKQKWSPVENTEKLTELNKKIVDLIGLDYDGFTRAIMLPQGAFDEFLRGSNSERRKLLVSLLGLEKIEAVQKLAGEKAKDAEREIKAIEVRLSEDYSGATVEALLQLEQQQQDLQVTQKEQQVALLAVTEAVQEMKELQELSKNHAQLQADVARLEPQKAELASNKTMLANAQRAAAVYPQWQQVDAYLSELRASQKTLQTYQAELATAQNNWQQAEAELAKARANAEKLPEIDVSLQGLEAARSLLEQLKAKGGNLKLLEQIPTSTGVYSAETWEAYQTHANHLPNLKRAVADVATAEQNHAKLLNKLTEAQQQQAQQEDELARLEQAGKESKAQFEDLQARLEAARTANQAEALRHALVVGEPCPVCTQQVEEIPEYDAHDLETLIQSQRTAQKDLETKRDAYRNQSQALKHLASRIGEWQAELAAAFAAYNIAQTKAKNAYLTFHEDLPAELQLSDRFLSHDITMDEDSPEKSSEKLPEKIVNVEIVENVTLWLEQTRKGLLYNLAEQIHTKTDGEDPQALHDRLQQEKQLLSENLNKSQQVANEAQRGLDKAQTRLESHTIHLNKLETQCETAQNSLNKKLAAKDFPDIKTMVNSYRDDSAIAALVKQIEQVETTAVELETRLAELTKELAGRTFDPTTYATASQQQNDLQTALANLQTRLGAISQQHTTMQAQLLKAAELQEKMTNLAQTYDIYKQLAKDLQSNRFQDFLILRVQQQLALRASEIIVEVSEGRYKLRMVDGEYHVIDGWNGGEMRSAKTLSGGETFIVSLSLALALSDTIASSASLGALFLDEGFGTLDSESLDAITQVLENLSTQGRIVGIITHVQELSSRLPDRLQVVKGREGSSLQWAQ